MKKNKARIDKYTEASLVASLKAGDNKAFGFLYDNYNEALFKIITRIIKDHEEASDTLQDVFINIYRKIETYDLSKGRLFTWMLNICINASIDKVRSADHRRIKNTCSLDKLSEHEIRVAALFAENLSVSKTLEMLSNSQRELINLSYFKGYTHGQISDMHGIPLGTVKSRIRNALKDLRRFLILEEQMIKASLAKGNRLSIQ
jgi:RNA polymerase sigma factor (sigma-70 family)